MPCAGTAASVIKEISITQPCCNLHEFHNAYRFISWTPEGNILNVQTTENDIQVGQIFSNNTKKHYLAGVFIQPQELHFATMDSNYLLQIFYMKGKEEVWSYQLPVECKMLLCHPKHPILFVGSADGRVFILVVNIELDLSFHR